MSTRILIKSIRKYKVRKARGKDPQSNFYELLKQFPRSWGANDVDKKYPKNIINVALIRPDLV